MEDLLVNFVPFFLWQAKLKLYIVGFRLPASGFERGNTALMNDSGSKFLGNWWGELIGGIIRLMRGDHRIRDAFARALFSTIAHINKADGLVTKKEI